MKKLNKSQLAFILDIKVDDARAKMCHAYSVANKIKEVERDFKGKLLDEDFPDFMEIAMLSEQLNLPTLQFSVDDICGNYLNRPASKKWILCDYPEKEIQKGTKDGKPIIKLTIPKVLRSMIDKSVQDQIVKEWEQRYEKKDEEGRWLIMVPLHK